jgi:hypothetical protein
MGMEAMTMQERGQQQMQQQRQQMAQQQQSPFGMNLAGQNTNAGAGKPLADESLATLPARPIRVILTIPSPAPRDTSLLRLVATSFRCRVWAKWPWTTWLARLTTGRCMTG